MESVVREKESNNLCCNTGCKVHVTERENVRMPLKEGDSGTA